MCVFLLEFRQPPGFTRTAPLIPFTTAFRFAGFRGFGHALRWLAPLDEPRRRAVDALLDGSFGEPVRITAGWEQPAPPQAKESQGSLIEFPEPEQLTIGRPSRDERQDYESLLALLTETRTLVAEERFLHWQVAFPGVWDNWEDRKSTRLNSSH